MTQTIISMTLHLRPDGTVNNVTQTTREIYTTPSGRQVIEEFPSEITLDDLKAYLNTSYAEFEKHNKQLENLIATERKEAEETFTTLRAQALNPAQET